MIYDGSKQVAGHEEDVQGSAETVLHSDEIKLQQYLYNNKQLIFDACINCVVDDNSWLASNWRTLEI